MHYYELNNNLDVAAGFIIIVGVHFVINLHAISNH